MSSGRYCCQSWHRALQTMTLTRLCSTLNGFTRVTQVSRWYTPALRTCCLGPGGADCDHLSDDPRTANNESTVALNAPGAPVRGRACEHGPIMVRLIANALCRTVPEQ